MASIISANPAATALEKQRRGLLQISISNYNNNTESEIQAGSIIEVGGALFEATSDESISNALSGFSDGVVYITTSVVDASNIEFEYTDTAPTWNDDLQGWYDATGTDRYIIAGVKSSTNYSNKGIFVNREAIENLNAKNLLVNGTQIVDSSRNFSNVNSISLTGSSIKKAVTNGSLFLFGGTGAATGSIIAMYGTDHATTPNRIAFAGAGDVNSTIYYGATGNWYMTGSVGAAGGIDAGSSGTAIKRKVVNIGAWNMDTTTSVSVSLGISSIQSFGIRVIIWQDWNAGSPNQYDLLTDGYYNYNGSTGSITLYRTASGFFDNANFDDGGTIGSILGRGKIEIIY